MPIDSKSTAVVLIEYQNHFTSDGGVLHGAVSEVMARTGMLAHTRAVVAAARSGYANGYQVITLSDCVAATSVEEHETALKCDYLMLSQPMTADEFIGQLA